MPVQDAAAANTALWASYLEDQWGPWLDPFTRRYVVPALAAAISGWLTLTYAPRVESLFREHAPAVGRFAVEARARRNADAVPAAYRRVTAPAQTAAPAPPPPARTRAIAATR